jgi:hypothetical protein
MEMYLREHPPASVEKDDHLSHHSADIDAHLSGRLSRHAPSHSMPQNLAYDADSCYKSSQMLTVKRDNQKNVSCTPYGKAPSEGSSFKQNMEGYLIERPLDSNYKTQLSVMKREPGLIQKKPDIKETVVNSPDVRRPVAFTD